MKENEIEIETVVAVEMTEQISVIEQSHRSALVSIHENMDKLIADCHKLTVDEDDKESYDKAVELKREVKATHVAIEKRRKELKQPLIDYGKRLDAFASTIYEPLVKAEKLVKSKMEAYEAKQEQLKKERKEKEAEAERERKLIDSKILELQNTLGLINSAKSKDELTEIENYLNSINLKDFGERSNDAGFILTQLKMTCQMAYKVFVSKDVENEIKSEKSTEIEKQNIGEDIPDANLIESIESTPKVVIQQNEVDANSDKTLFTKNSEPEVSVIKHEDVAFESNVDIQDKVSESDVVEEIISTSENAKHSYLDIDDDELLKHIEIMTNKHIDSVLSKLEVLTMAYLGDVFPNKYKSTEMVDKINSAFILNISYALKKSVEKK